MVHLASRKPAMVGRLDSLIKAENACVYYILFIILLLLFILMLVLLLILPVECTYVVDMNALMWTDLLSWNVNFILWLVLPRFHSYLYL